ncbi:bifunctional non-homologous end joining protein LigD [Kineosphaera limosa]|nr:bifunctional non-homologous end joining protein LigD [Kineosphaera limosa]
MLTNLDKVLYPTAGFTKAEVMQYLTAVAPALLPQLRRRTVTRVRWPHGTGSESFFEKNLPAGSPRWVQRVSIASASSRSTREGREPETVVYPLIDNVAGLVWLANLAALELHVHQWRVDAEGVPQIPDRLVVDLDPGPPAGLGECAQVALLVREALQGVLPGPIIPVTSGNKGLQLYVPTPQLRAADDTRALAQGLAEALAAQHPHLVVSRMTKAVRPGKVFLDWSQNTRAKTTICPYSLRGRGGSPTVAAPRSWAEIERAANSEVDVLRQLTPRQVLERLQRDGDLMNV